MGVETLPLVDLREEVVRVLDAAERTGVVLRAVGGLGVFLRCPSARVPPLVRPYKDLDLVGRRGEARPISDLLISLGYLPAEEFNKLHGHQRLYFWDPQNERQLDVFIQRISMCHELDLGGRLESTGRTLSPADLLLTKLQVVELNERDLKDGVALLADHPIEATGIDPARIVEVLASDWGWWRTSTRTLDSIADYAAGLDELQQKVRVVEAVRNLRERIDAAPKTLRWRLRSLVGERLPWFELPEEVTA